MSVGIHGVQTAPTVTAGPDSLAYRQVDYVARKPGPMSQDTSDCYPHLCVSTPSHGQTGLAAARGGRAQSTFLTSIRACAYYFDAAVAAMMQ